MRIRTGIAAAATVLGMVASAQATMLVSWDFYGNSGATAGDGTISPTATTAPGIEDTTLTRYSLGSGDTKSFGTDCYTVGGDGNLPHPQGYDPNSSDYVSFTIAPTAGNELSISDLDVSAGIQDADGTTDSGTESGWELRSSLDDFATNLGDIEGYGVDTNTISTIDLTGFDDLTVPVEFRLYPFGAANGYETGSLGKNDNGGVDNGPGLYVDGTVSSLPEPASLALLGMAGLGLMTRRRRRSCGPSPSDA